jgi:S-adenosylmethionine uptake transporter
MTTPSENLRGAGLMALAMAGYVLNDTCIKALSAYLTLPETLFLRGLVTSLLLGAWVIHKGLWRVALGREDLMRVFLRTACEVAGSYFFLSALFHMPLANATAVMQALPLTVTLIGAVIFAEPLGWRRLSAIAIGMIGVLLIVRPGPDGFNVYTVYVLAAVACITLRDLVTRRLAGHVSSLMVALWASIGMMILGAALGPADTLWTLPPARAWAQLLAASGFIIVAYVFSVMAMRVGDIGFVSPFRYTGMIWALILGLVFFGEFPDMVTLLGAGIVTASGVFTLLRERRIARQLAGAPEILGNGL